MSYSIIKLLNSNRTIYYKKNITLLIVFEENKIFLDSQCREGYCGSCRIKLLKGNVYYKNQLPLASYKSGDIFPCCCTANGNISVNI